MTPPHTAALATPARRGSHPTIALAVVVTCQLMVVLDATVVNIALPDIKVGLGFSATDLSWVLNAYTLAFGGLLLLGGRIGDVLGRRQVFMFGVSLFTLASLVGGFAQSSGMLVAARAVQGVGAAIAAPSVLALITTNFPEGPPRNKALGIFTAVSAGGGSIGLLLGGVLTDIASWRWVLFINVPIGIAIVLLAPLYIEAPARGRARLDIVGALTSTAGMTSLAYGFIHAASTSWGDGVTVVALAAGVGLLALFVTIESRVAEPLLPLRLFAARRQAAAYGTMALLPATMFGMFFFLTQFMQDVLGYTPLQTGLAFLPLTVLLFICSQIVPRLLPRYGNKPFLIVGIALILTGMLALTQISEQTTYFPGLLIPTMIFGLGGGAAFMPLSATILSGVPVSDSGAAAGALQTAQQVGGSLGLAILVTVFGTAGADLSQDTAPAVLAHSMSTAFTAGAIFGAAALLMALIVVTSPHPVPIRPHATPGDDAEALTGAMAA
ncbi:MAG: efpA4 [Solirubrobacterales bacterium]|nr:efpA4 [Solirubrobacterales bacterium]